MSTDLQQVESSAHAPALATPPTIGELQERLAKAREYMAHAMTEGKDGDYWVIPGTGGKPSLLKPGAEKLARLFGLSIVTHQRTMLQQVDDDGWVAGYTVTLAGPDGRTWGGAESFAAEAEPTFKRQPGSGAALFNSLTARAQKRAYSRAVIQAIGLSDLFTGDAPGGDELLSERQRDIIVALYERTAPRMVDQVRQQATKIRASVWAKYLGSALDLAADVHHWTEKDRERAQRTLSDDLATRDDVDALFPIEGEVLEYESMTADERREVDALAEAERDGGER